MESQNLFSVSQFIEKNPAFTNGGIRSIIFNADKNGLAQSGALLRIGRKILIHSSNFYKWIEDQNQQGSSS